MEAARTFSIERSFSVVALAAGKECLVDLFISSVEVTPLISRHLFNGLKLSLYGSPPSNHFCGGRQCQQLLFSYFMAKDPHVSPKYTAIASHAFDGGILIPSSKGLYGTDALADEKECPADLLITSADISSLARRQLSKGLGLNAHGSQ